MFGALETARQQIAEGKYKKAIDTLWVVEAESRADPDQTRALTEVVSSLRAVATGRVERQCDELLDQARANAQRLKEVAEGPLREAVAVLRHCKVLGGHGLPPRVGEDVTVVFTDSLVRFMDAQGEETSVPYSELTAIEIGGPGATRSGGGFIGGGFGLQGAAEGMLVASALNLLTTRTSIDTVVCLQTRDAELFLLHHLATPDSLRMQLSRVFTVLRQRVESVAETAPPSGRGDAVEQLAKLSGLLDRGLIDEAEFRRLKADILG